jgi:acetate kinase
MGDCALVVNAGSSSVKFSVYHKAARVAWKLDARGQVDGIGTSPRFRVVDGDGMCLTAGVPDGALDVRSAFDAMAGWLRSRYGGARVLGVGHRVVHGGAQFAGPALVTPKVLSDLRGLIPLAPLHQPYNIAAIDAVSERLPQVPQVACFDTSFHRTAPPVASVVPLPRELCGNVQRYGFHGLSYEYIASVLPKVAPDIASGRVIVAHLGSGASLCAMVKGRSVDHTFGFTALDGLCMGTRPGAIDPGVILYLIQALGLPPKEIETVLYRKSGLLGISGISSDMRDLLRSHEPGARLAVDYFVYRAVREIGALSAVLGGLDGLVFTGGIGENSPEIRKRICDGCRWVGIESDDEANTSGRPQISLPGSRVSAWVVPTNEELMIARQTGALLGWMRPVSEAGRDLQTSVRR